MRSLALLALLLLTSASCRAQSTEADLNAQLLHKPLFLRGLWQNDNLKFDATGKLQTGSYVLPYTLAGIEITNVELTPAKLVLVGRRTGIEFSNGIPHSVVLIAGGRGKAHEQQVHLEIAAPADSDYSHALDKIFAANLTDLVPSLPPEWQFFAQKFLLHPDQPYNPKIAQPPSPAGTSMSDVGVSPPKVRFAAQPESSVYLQSMRPNNTVSLIFLVVDEQGRPTQLQVIRPVGLGVDEQALKAVRQYVFTPAKANGHPVAVVMNVEVNCSLIY